MTLDSFTSNVIENSDQTYETEETLISGHLSKDSIDGITAYGGPAGIISGFLAQKYDHSASVHSIIGTDSFSQDYLSLLESLGVKADFISVKEGEISTCKITNFPGSQQEIHWSDNISENFPFFEGNIAPVRHLILPSSQPEVAVDLVNRVGKDCCALYNPGTDLMALSPEEVQFDKIISRANYLQLNAEEDEKVQQYLNSLSLHELFSYQNLEVVVITGKTKNLVLTRDGDLEILVDTNEDVNNTTGAGDTLLASFFYNYKIGGRPLRESLEIATRDATARVNSGNISLF